MSLELLNRLENHIKQLGEKHQAQKKEFDNLKAQIEVLQIEKISLLDEHELLKMELDEVKTNYQSLQDRIGDLLRLDAFSIASDDSATSNNSATSDNTATNNSNATSLNNDGLPYTTSYFSNGTQS